jgi:hypothetical protein
MARTKQKDARTTDAAHTLATPQREHRWLEKLVGDWTAEGKMIMPGGATQETTGTERVRSLEGLWFIAEGTGEMPDGQHGTTILTLGYDTAQGMFVGTFIGSMMTHQWVYEGELDEEEKTLVLDTIGPEMTEAGMGTRLVPYQDRIEFEDDDHRVLRSYRKGSSGAWEAIVEVHYHRRLDATQARGV